MKIISFILFSCCIMLSCVKREAKEITNLVYYHNIPNLEQGDCKYGRYYKQTAKYKQDTIFVYYDYYDEHFIVKNNRINNIKEETYIQDGLDLYKLNLKGEKKLYFTMKNDDKVFFERKSSDSVDSLGVPEAMDLFMGYQHSYRGITTLLSSKNETVEVYKFLVSRTWYDKERPDCDDVYYDNEYFFYYTKDFLLYKIEYLGQDRSMDYNWECERLGSIEDIFGI